MAMQTYVFFQKADIPSLDNLQAAILKEGFKYELPNNFEISKLDESFIEGKFEGLESCFDYLYDKYDAADWDWSEDDLNKLGSPDGLSVFNTYSNAQEITGMLVVSSVLTKLTSGVMLSEFFEDDLISPEECVKLAKDIIENSRDQFNGPSKLRG